MNRAAHLVSLLTLVLVVLLAACSQSSAPAAPSAQKPVEKAVEKVVDTALTKPVEKPAEKPPAAKPAEKVEAKPVAKAEAKPAPPKDLPTSAAIGTNPVATSYHSTGSGVAKVISDHSVTKVLVKPFAGPNAWMPLLESGEIQLGVASGLDAGWAYFGGTGYDKTYKNIRLLVKGNSIVIPGLVVRNDSDIKSIKDLRGKRVGSEYGGNFIMHVHATAFMESVGLTWNDVKPVPVTDINTGLRALREGRADAVFGGSPLTGVSLETDAAIGLRALNFGDIPPEQAANVPKDLVEKLRKHLPGEEVVLVKKQGYLKSDATLYQHAIYLFASGKLSSDAAYEATRVVYENDKELQPIYDWLKDWKQGTMFNLDPPAPYHDGAIRFWKEKGKWTPAAEANQKKLLGQ